MQKPENYNDLYVFYMVAKEMSFTKASNKLNISQSGVSHTIRALEKRLKVALFQRTTRSIALTEAGLSLYKNLSLSFEQINSSLQLLDDFREKKIGRVRITSSLDAIKLLLLPKLADFSKRYPDISIELISENRFVDIIGEQYDAGIRLAEDVAEGMVSVKIGEDMKMCLVATPGFFAKNGIPKNPEDLKNFSCINYRLSSGGLYNWELNVNGKVREFAVSGQWYFSDNFSIKKATLLGLGLAYLPSSYVEEEIKEGKLLRVMDEYSLLFKGFCLYYPPHSVSPALRLVIDELRLK